MIEIEEALSLVINQRVNRQIEVHDIQDALSYTLAESIKAPSNLPSFDNSAMDGYAISGVHAEYRIIGQIQAGDNPSLVLSDGEAIRIFTGAPIPSGCTSVIMQEHVVVEEHHLRPQRKIVLGKNIRKAGKQISKGSLVFEQGSHLNESALGILASLGIQRVSVYQKPRIALILTGNELISPGHPIQHGQIYESNSFAINGALKRYGYECKSIFASKDSHEEIKTTIGTALANHDLVLISGGISVGDYDFVHQALDENDVKEIFYKIYQKPGKPLYFGRQNDKFVFALPGNPASSLTCFYIYVLPFLHHYCGIEQAKGLKKIRLPLDHDYENRFDRPTFLKAAIIESGRIQILDGQSSSMIYAMSRSNALVLMKGKEISNKGETVSCWLL